jgi:hypothetical protein
MLIAHDAEQILRQHGGVPPVASPCTFQRAVVAGNFLMQRSCSVCGATNLRGHRWTGRLPLRPFGGPF